MSLEQHLRDQLARGVKLDAGTYLSGYFDGWNDALTAARRDLPVTFPDQPAESHSLVDTPPTSAR